jgi:GMP synthase (glutamine-hydrolysing)
VGAVECYLHSVQSAHEDFAGVILSGSPYSVYDADSPHADPAVYELGVPILGICYGLQVPLSPPLPSNPLLHRTQEMAWHHKGVVAKCSHREYGFAALSVVLSSASSSPWADKLFAGLGNDLDVWMSHGDQLEQLPTGWHVIGKTPTAPFAAIAHDSRPFFGIQFHAEVTHSKRGKEVIANFVTGVCAARTNWTMVRIGWNTASSCAADATHRKSSLGRRSRASGTCAGRRGA